MRNRVHELMDLSPPPLPDLVMAFSQPMHAAPSTNALLPNRSFSSDASTAVQSPPTPTASLPVERYPSSPGQASPFSGSPTAATTFLPRSSASDSPSPLARRSYADVRLPDRANVIYRDADVVVLLEDERKLAAAGQYTLTVWDWCRLTRSQSVPAQATSRFSSTRRCRPSTTSRPPPCPSWHDSFNSRIASWKRPSCHRRRPAPRPRASHQQDQRRLPSSRASALSALLLVSTRSC